MDLSPESFAIIYILSVFGFSSLIFFGFDVGRYFARKFIKRLKNRSSGSSCNLSEDDNKK